jgi:hypothetical protein
MTDREEFEAKFPIPQFVDRVDGDYVANSVACSALELREYRATWEGWQARGMREGRNIDNLVEALLEAETAEQIIGCRDELLTAWMGWQAQQEPVVVTGKPCVGNSSHRERGMSLQKELRNAANWEEGLTSQVMKKAADALDALTTELAAAKKDAERWKYWKPRMIAADFEWGQFKEPVLVFSLNCKVSADIDKSTDEAIAAQEKV